MKGRAIEYLPEELAWIEARKDWPRARLHSAFLFMFGRDDVTEDALKALCHRKGWKTGRTGCFEKGRAGGVLSEEHKAALLKAGAATRFSKGSVPHNYRGPGHESIDTKDGYVWLIVAERNPHTGAATRRVMKHRWLWEQAHGPVPEGHVLKCLDGNRQNTDPSNWQAIPQAMNARLNGRFGRGYDSAPAELKPTIMAITTVEHAAREARKGARK